MTTTSTTPVDQAALVLMMGTLTKIAATDPSRHGHTGPDTPETAAQYNRRNALIWAALAQAHEAGIPAGVGYDPNDPHPVVVYLELPGAGQVSWHLPAHAHPWDGHTTTAKYQRVDLFTGAHGPFSLCQEDDCTRCGEIGTAMEAEWRAAVAARGIHLVDVATLPPAQRAEHDRQALLSAMADEHAAAADPDPDYGRDLDGDE